MSRAIPQTVLQKCHNCGNEWWAAMFHEPDTDFWGYEDEDVGPFCPECGHEDEGSHDCTKCSES